MRVGQAAERRAERATGEEGRHVKAVEAASILGAEHKDRSLTEHEIRGHAEVQQDAGRDQQA